MVSRPSPLPPIRGLEPVSLTAWEGKVVAVLQLQGCNFKCPECSVPHLIPQVFEGGTIPIESALEAIHRRRQWLDAVVIAGGEPTLHEGLREFVRLIRELGVPVRLHTNGSHPEELRDILETGELASVAMTVRGPLDPTYAVAVGARVRLAAVYESVELLLRWPGEHEFRVPWLPNVVEQAQMTAVLRMLAGAHKVVLEQSADGQPGLRALQQVARTAGSYVESCVLAGRPGQDFGARGRSRSISSRDAS